MEKEVKKGGKVERLTIGFEKEGPSVCKVGKCYETLFFSFLQLKKISRPAISQNQRENFQRTIKDEDFDGVLERLRGIWEFSRCFILFRS